MKQVTSQVSLFHRQIEQATQGQQPYLVRTLLEDGSKENAQVIPQYILAVKQEINASSSHQRKLLKNLMHLSAKNHHKSQRKSCSA